MLKILVVGQVAGLGEARALDLGEQLSLTFKEESPALSFAFVGGDYSYSFSIPKTRANQTTLDNRDVIERSENGANYVTVQLYLLNRLWKEGRMVFTSFRDVYVCSYQGALGGFQEKIQGKKLWNLNLGTLDPPNFYTHAKDTAVNPDNHNHIFFPINIPDFSDADNNPVWEGVFNQYDPLNNLFYGNSTYTDPDAPEFRSLLAPFIKSNAVIKAIFEGAGYKVDMTALENSQDFNRLCILTKRHLNKPTQNLGTGLYRYAPVGSYPLAGRLPDFDQTSFLLNFNKLLGTVLLIDAKSLEAKVVTYNQLNDLPERKIKGKVLDYWKVPEAKEGYSFTYDGQPSKVVGLGVEDIATTFKLTAMESVENQKAIVLPGPLDAKYGIIPSLELSDFGDSDIRLVNYEGIKSAQAFGTTRRPYNYPQGVTTPYFDYFSTNLSFFNMDGLLSNEYLGLYTRRWKKWTDRLFAGRKVSIDYVPDAQDVTDFSFLEKAIIGRYGGIPLQRTLKITHNSIRAEMDIIV